MITAAPSRWRRFALGWLAGALGLGAALWATILLIDPYGIRVGPGRAPTPIMDLNGRYMYPQLARSGLFDSAIFGSSTIRLLDPLRLASAFGGRFANLGLNAGTPWEQLQLAELFLRHVPEPTTLILGLDRTWCEADADAPGKRITFRSFPLWLYDETPWNDWPELLSLRTLEIAARVVLHRLGRMKQRIRGDGYEVFLPPDVLYDPARAAALIHAPDATPPSAVPGRLPALDWLDGFVARLPGATRLVLLLPPITVAAQAAPGTPAAEADALCKTRLRSLATRRQTTLVDFRLASPLTRDDGSYWDKLHYREPVATRIVAALAAAVATGRDGPDGLYRTVSSP